VKISLIGLFIIFSFHVSPSNAQLEDCLCTKNPTDCEVGILSCKLTALYNGQTFAHDFAEKYKKGDDSNPEIGSGKRFEVDKTKRLDLQVFAAACDKKLLHISVSGILWGFLPPDYPTIDSFHKLIRNIPFDSQELKIEYLSQKENLKFIFHCRAKALS